MAAKTFAQLRDLIFAELGEAGTDALAALPSGTGTNAIAISGTDNLRRLINEGKNKTFRVAALYRAVGTKAVAVGDLPVVHMGDLTLTTTSGGAATAQFLNTATDVSFAPAGSGAVALSWMAPEAFDNWFAKIPILRVSGTPKYWAHTHETAHDIQLDQVPNVAGVLTVYGYGAPPDLVADTDTVGGLIEDGYRAIVCYVCGKLCRKNNHDERMAGLVGVFDAECFELWAQLRSQISAAAQKAYLEPLVPKQAPGSVPVGQSAGADGQ